MNRNIIKVLDRGFSDISAGEKMLISSPEKISEFIFAIPKGSFLTIKELRKGLVVKAGADNTCPVTTRNFLVHTPFKFILFSLLVITGFLYFFVF